MAGNQRYLQDGADGRRWHTLYLTAIRVYRPKLSEKQLQRVTAWGNEVRSSIAARELKYAREDRYDRLPAQFPEMRESLAKPFGTLKSVGREPRCMGAGFPPGPKSRSTGKTRMFIGAGTGIELLLSSPENGQFLNGNVKNTNKNTNKKESVPLAGDFADETRRAAGRPKSLNRAACPVQPVFTQLEVRQGALDPPPELGGVMGFVQVRHFVHYDILSNASWQQDGLPVKIQPAALPHGPQR